MPRGVLDRHIGPSACDDDGLNAEALQQAFQLRPAEAVHPHFFDDEVAFLGFEPGNSRCTPATAHDGIRLFDPLVERSIEFEPLRPASTI